MAFYANVGYKFTLPDSVVPQGSVLLSSAMPAHQLIRRKFDARYPHLERRVFDPQLYLAGLDAGESAKHCAVLASHSWFGVKGLKHFDSRQHTQSEWKQKAVSEIPTLWTGRHETDPAKVQPLVRDCIDFQVRLGCEAVILPSPLTSDPSTSYVDELMWLDSALAYVETLGDQRPRVYATIALADVCLRYSDPPDNALLALIADVVSAREIDGVYLVVEQGSEAVDTRQCGNKRTLWSLLHLTHAFAVDAGLDVAVNFIGPFGLACEAVGAKWWASAWYKSLYRVRLADKLGGGRSYPSYWSYPAALDVNLERDFDALVRAGQIDRFADRTPACEALLRAAARGTSVARVPAWAYRQSNITAATEHFLLSAVQAEELHQRRSGIARMDFVSQWLERAKARSVRLASLGGRDLKSKVAHVQGWHDAFKAYRETQGV